MKPAVIILGPSALATGERAARAIDGELHGRPVIGNRTYKEVVTIVPEPSMT